MWQALHNELESAGLSVVTVALDVDPENAKPWISQAHKSASGSANPSLIDTEHVTDTLFGFTNVPMAVWIDEQGQLVRPPELASIEKRPDGGSIPDEFPDRIKQILGEVAKFRGDAEGYLAAIHDWVENGSDSEFALSPDEVVARSNLVPVEHARAAACFELGLWHWNEHPEAGEHVKWWQEAHDLHPENWTYKRQAWTFVTSQEGQPPDLLQGPNDVYEGDWFGDVMAQGGGVAYYEPPAL